MTGERPAGEPGTAQRPADAALGTERCWIRSWRPEDAERVFDIYRRFEVCRWLGRTPQPLERKADGVVAGTVSRRLGMTALGRTTTYYDTELELFRVRPDALRESDG